MVNIHHLAPGLHGAEHTAALLLHLHPTARRGRVPGLWILRTGYALTTDRRVIITDRLDVDALETAENERVRHAHNDR